MRPTNTLGALCLLSSLLALNVLPLSVKAQKNQSKSAAPASESAAGDTVDPQAGITHKTTPLTPAAYEYLLDVLFPIDRSLSPALDYMMVLRFEPHLHPETQIVIRRFHNGKIDATLSQVASGNAWSAAYQQVVPGESPNFQLIASNIQLRDRRFHVDERQLDEWHKQIFPVLKKHNARVESKDKAIQRKGNNTDHEVGTIGARYELWFIQLNDEEHMVAWDSETENTPTGSSELTQWMNRVRLFAQGQVNTGSGPTRPGIAKALPMTPGAVAPTEPVAEASAPVQPAPEQPMMAQPAAAPTVAAASNVAMTPGAAAATAQPASSQPVMEQPTAATNAAVASSVTMSQGQPAAQPAQGSVMNPAFPQPGHAVTAASTAVATPATQAPAAMMPAAQPAPMLPAAQPAATVAATPATSSDHRPSAIHLAPAPNKKPAVPTTSSLGITSPSPASMPATPAASGNIPNPVFPQPGHPDTYTAPAKSPASPR